MVACPQAWGEANSPTKEEPDLAQRKLGRTADQRKALIRNQVTNLIWYGRIETTEARAKEVRRAAERLITLAVNECGNT